MSAARSPGRPAPGKPIERLEQWEAEQAARITPNGVTEAIEAFSFDPSGLYRPTHIVDQDLASLFPGTEPHRQFGAD